MAEKRAEPQEPQTATFPRCRAGRAAHHPTHWPCPQVFLPEGYLAGVYREMRAAGAVCVADEVQCGFGRVGRAFWAFELQGVVPDIVTFGESQPPARAWQCRAGGVVAARTTGRADLRQCGAAQWSAPADSPELCCTSAADWAGLVKPTGWSWAHVQAFGLRD